MQHSGCGENNTDNDTVSTYNELKEDLKKKFTLQTAQLFQLRQKLTSQ